jgi:hypothetical protein
MDNEKNKKYISASHLGMYQRCGLQYQFRYIDKKKIPPGIALLKGAGVHGGARINFRQKKESKVDLPKKDIIEISVTEFENTFQSQGVFLTQEEETIGLKNVLGSAKDSIVTLASLYADQVAPIYQPIYVEESHRIVVPNSEYDLLAVMDLATENERVVDLKTGAKKKTDSEVQASDQLTFYALVYRALTGKMPKKVCLEVLVDKKNPERQLLEGQRDLRDLQVLVKRINLMIDGLSKGVFIPAPPTSWWCSPRFCGYWNICNAVNHG